MSTNDKIAWSPEEWIASGPTVLDRSDLGSYVQIVKAVEETIRYAEEIAQRRTDIAQQITKQIQILRNATAKLVVAGETAKANPTPENKQALEQADMVVAYNHKELLTLMKSKPQTPEQVAQTEQALVAELTAATQKLLAWSQKPQDIIDFPDQFDSAVNECVMAFSSCITGLFKNDIMVQVELLEALQKIADLGANIAEAAQTKSLTKEAINEFFTTLYATLQKTTTAIKTRKQN